MLKQDIHRNCRALLSQRSDDSLTNHRRSLSKTVKCRFRCGIHLWLKSAIPFGHYSHFLSCSYIFVLTMNAHAFNAPPSLCIIVYHCTNLHCWKVFTQMYSFTIKTATMQQGHELSALVSWCAQSSAQYAGQTVPQPLWVLSWAQVTKETTRAQRDQHVVLTTWWPEMPPPQHRKFRQI